MHRANSSPHRYPDAGRLNASPATARAAAAVVVAYQHEFTLGVQHAGAHGLVPVVEDDDVEPDGLRHGEEERQHPDGHDLHHGHHGDPHPLNSAPGRHGSVPAHTNTPNGAQATHSLSPQHGSTPNPTKRSVSKADQNVKN